MSRPHYSYDDAIPQRVVARSRSARAHIKAATSPLSQRTHNTIEKIASSSPAGRQFTLPKSKVRRRHRQRGFDPASRFATKFQGTDWSTSAKR